MPDENSRYLRDISQSIERLTRAVEKINVRPTSTPTSIEEPVASASPPLTIEKGKPGPIMSDGYGPLYIRYELPYGHGTIIYKRRENTTAPGEFDIVIEDHSGNFEKYVTLKDMLNGKGQTYG